MLVEDEDKIGIQSSESDKLLSVWRELWDVVETILLALILYFGIDAVFARVQVENISMETTFMPGDVLVVNRLAYKYGDYKTGDVVIFHNPNYEEEDFIKRVIGTPGDTVVIRTVRFLSMAKSFRRITFPSPHCTKANGTCPTTQYLCWVTTAADLQILIFGVMSL